MTSKMSKVIDAMNTGLFTEIDNAFDNTYVINRQDAIKDLADHYCAELFTGKNRWLKECTSAWEEKFMEFEEEYDEMSNKDIETEYYDAFDVRVVIE